MATMLRSVVGVSPVPGWRVTTFVGRARWLVLAHAAPIRIMAPLLLIASLCIVAGARYAPKSLRRSAAALPKIRIPNTTMMAVDSCVPTPNWSPT
ncbi:hypothetical protein NJB14197_43710 [Mycobacterium montefiorense]|uniref:Uncharacterized protein n=1 Tax=Mycobacterium montefiorense TaxID=154654 RepID=A0AA37PJT5_9MYCO|nr:hypothetical protein MmonteBS_32670 [Mycobacterium montefiorense]GKU32683.1 hypothetical protein NJB14191_00300 [Mycobacterium montefiorense]GKU38205.1 hypothetical protein NJB14192_02030 [Mycobacterium montefiorense]GKU43493.1 hypothetical protein NJB14194_01260 [Mycobacterium montefiorense]GKU50234.1 hypothetical protein NJB14195_14800 [Mycobacterium montefiorense]